MSQEFLNHLLSTTKNRVRSKPGATCMICLEDYNTLNTSTGVVEWEVALPCGHRVGSSCIVTWLQTNNNCPACRAMFFPKQPRPYLEDGIILNAGRARTAMVPAPIPPVVPTPTTRTAQVPATTRRVLLKRIMNSALDCTIAFGITALGVGMGIYFATYLPEVQLFVLETDYLIGVRWNEFWSTFAPAEAADQARRCMEWQDCSFLYGPLE